LSSVHPRLKLHANLIDLLQRELPTIDGGKTVRGNSIRRQLIDASLKLFRPFIQIDQINKVDVPHRIRAGLIDDLLKMIFEIRIENRHAADEKQETETRVN
jgi:hypothetical protein